MPGPAVPWSRTYTDDQGKRHNNKRLSNYKKHVRAAASTGLVFWQREHPTEVWPTDGIYRLMIDVYCTGRRRGDASNYLKGVEDALEGVLYENDRQLAVVVSRVFITQDEARIEGECSVIQPLDARYADYAGMAGHLKDGRPFARTRRG